MYKSGVWNDITLCGGYLLVAGAGVPSARCRSAWPAPGSSGTPPSLAVACPPPPSIGMKGTQREWVLVGGGPVWCVCYHHRPLSVFPKKHLLIPTTLPFPPSHAFTPIRLAFNLTAKTVLHERQLFQLCESDREVKCQICPYWEKKVLLWDRNMCSEGVQLDHGFDKFHILD